MQVVKFFPDFAEWSGQRNFAPYANSPTKNKEKSEQGIIPMASLWSLVTALASVSDWMEISIKMLIQTRLRKSLLDI
jgi:hypothetical protein